MNEQDKQKVIEMARRCEQALILARYYSEHSHEHLKLKQTAQFASEAAFDVVEAVCI